MSIVPALNVSTYATRSMYVTPAEFKAAPTGVDVSQLIPGDNSAAHQLQALVMQLQRASAVADKICRKVLAATIDTQAGNYRIQQDPMLGPVIRVPLDFIPITAVSAVSIGSTPSALAPLTDLSNVWISKKVATIPLGSDAPGRSFVSTWGGRRYATVQYVNGWANTTLTSSVAPAATSITVASPLGIMPGQQINLVNTNNAEIVTISPTWVPVVTGANVTIPLAGAVVGTYSAADTVTAMSQEVKQAVILIAKSLILTRGSDAIEIASSSAQPTHVIAGEPAVASDLEFAEFLLADYVRAA